jgi:ribosomal protein S18 acetylase RimI-like enzyme
MAAARAGQPGKLEILDLRHFRSADFASLLEEEGRIWAERLCWDSADIARRYLDQRALNGYALVDGSTPVGYGYYVPDEHKALIGDLFVSAPYRTQETEHTLLRHVIETAQHVPGVRRIEGQLMMVESPGVAALYPPSELAVFERNFMLVESIGRLPREAFGAAARGDVVFERWSEKHLESTAQLIARSYHWHVDSQINDQYESVAGARRFLHNITHYPGCGAFHYPAAMAAIDRWEGELCGISLASLVAPRVGHLTQVCVSPPMRGRGIGSELLWRSTQAFCAAGGEAISLTVTASNTGAVQLYERIGFRTIRRFRAYVWKGFGG